MDIFSTMQKSDSLQLLSNEIKSLNHRLDSIANVVYDTQLGKDFFSSIIEEQTGIFSAIIVFVALISLGGLFGYLKIQIRNEVKKMELNFKKLEQKNKIIEEDSQTLNFNSLFTIYHIFTNNNDHYRCLRTALMVCKWTNRYLCGDILLEVEKKKEQLERWVIKSTKDLKKITDSGDKLEKYKLDELVSIIDFQLPIIKDEDILKKLNDIKNELYRIHFTS